jgi:hypothetical protein
MPLELFKGIAIAGFENMSKSTSPDPEKIAKVMSHLLSDDVEATKLAKDIAMFAYNEERKKTDVIEQRAFGLMQFAKVGLTIIAGIAGLISNASIHDTPFRESLILLLAIASVYLAKLFWRGAGVVRIGTTFEPYPHDHVKPDQDDVYATQSGEKYLEILKTHVAKMVLYFDHTATDNAERIYQCKCCYVNTSGFLVAFFLFFGLSLMHLFEPNLTLLLPDHRVIGCALIILALVTDWLVEVWLKKEKRPLPY